MIRITKLDWRALIAGMGAVLLLAGGLGGCMEQLIEHDKGDAAPPVNAAEVEMAAETGKLCDNCTVAEFNANERRLALPNNLVLPSLNAAIAAAGGTELTGTVRTMPVRIPFDGAIQYPFADPASPDTASIEAWASSLFILDTADPTTPIYALPYYAGGTFKAVYLDANNDLVLVPGATTFANGKTYAVVVTKGIMDAEGDPIDESFLFGLLKSETPLVDDRGSAISVLSDEQAAALEAGRLEMATLLTALEAAGTDRSNIALIFTFTVETVDSLDATAGMPALLAGMEQYVALMTSGDSSIQWYDSSGSLVDDPAGAADQKAGDDYSIYPTDNLAAIYHGVYPCLSFLVPDATVPEDYALEVPPDPTDNTACPNANGNSGMMEFRLSQPSVGSNGIVVFQHGITRTSLDFAAIADTLAQAGLATIAIDLWAHGSRIYQIDNEDVIIIRPDDPAKTVGYLLQSRMDIEQLRLMVENSSEIAEAAGGTFASYHLVGVSLGGIVGSMAVSSGAVTFDSVVLNVAGGDLTDIILEGIIGAAQVIPGVAEVMGQEVGSPELNSTLLGLEMSVRHALFAGMADPLSVYDPSTATLPAEVLLQEITGDIVVPNNNSELLSRVMGLTTFSDGDSDQDAAPYRARWILDPANYTPGDAEHGFLLDGATTATAAGQTQIAEFILVGTLDDPTTTTE